MEKEQSGKKNQRLRGICNRISNANHRHLSSGYNKLTDAYKQRRASLLKKIQFILKAIKNSDAMYKLKGYNALKEKKLMIDGVGVGHDVQQKINFCKRIIDNAKNLEYQAVRSLTEFLIIRRGSDGKLKMLKENICKRILNKEVRVLHQGFRSLRVFAKLDWEREIARIRRIKGICERIRGSSAMLVSMGFNSLKTNNHNALMQSRATSELRKMKNNLLENMLKTKKMNVRRELDVAMKTLRKNAKTAIMRDRIIHRLLGACYLKNDKLMIWGYNRLYVNNRKADVKRADMRLKLERLKIYAEAKHKMMKQRSLFDFRVNFQVNLTYRKCRKLYKSLETSDRCIHRTYSLYWRLLRHFRKLNKWYKISVWYVTKNTRISDQIAFWRLRDMRTAINSMPAEMKVKVKRMGDVLYKAYVMRVARAFWRIDRWYGKDPDQDGDYDLSVSGVGSSIVGKKSYKAPSWSNFGGGSNQNIPDLSFSHLPDNKTDFGDSVGGRDASFDTPPRSERNHTPKTERSHRQTGYNTGLRNQRQKEKDFVEDVSEKNIFVKPPTRNMHTAKKASEGNLLTVPKPNMHSNKKIRVGDLETANKRPELKHVEQNPLPVKKKVAYVEDAPKKELTAFEKRRAKFLADKGEDKQASQRPGHPTIPQTERSSEAKPYWAKRTVPEYK
jgi:hypothetical protein